MDNNHLKERLKRYASVSTTATSFAARLVGERFLGMTLDHEAQAQALTQAFGQLKGPAMKIVQFLSTVPDAIPVAYADQLQTLQSQAPPMGWPFVKRRMQAELGSSWSDHFRHFSREATFAASLGQVHKATLMNGEMVACKLQYPHMESHMEADIHQLNVALKIFEKISPVLKFDAIRQEIIEHLREELNYFLEAKNSQIYATLFNSTPWIHVPRVYNSLTTQRLLTMEWLEGCHLKDLSSDQDTRNLVAERLFHAWYYPFYYYGVIHGDPHLGNYTFQSNHDINLLDFGCVRKFSSHFVKGVLTLFYGLYENRPDDVADAYKSWGFKDLTHEKIEVLNLWAHMIYEPLMDDRVRFIQKDNRGLEGRHVAEKVFQELKRLGGVHPPREFVFMDRAAVGIGSAFMHLKAKLNWHELFMTLIQDFDQKTVELNQKAVSIL